MAIDGRFLDAGDDYLVGSCHFPCLGRNLPLVLPMPLLHPPPAYCGRWKLGCPCLSYCCKLDIIVEIRNQRVEGVPHTDLQEKMLICSGAQYGSFPFLSLSFSLLISHLCCSIFASSFSFPVPSCLSFFLSFFLSISILLCPSLLLVHSMGEIDGKQRD
ncbi:hypothetical protein M441DRAFT_240998 [Trichoderma asperellum CBS 433.97]|uniref:Uncharacterized protein n=1 Tax=Trichoderma asperellum (strain ATCC 204424 / CBS 433.97 / NBRC 101777) TaxID=1042311 RepID=A0A2T3Z275_TRIA4|nr:hypothetical protein M441DRAFT_240998 [Trichoderma asperellum CBS 433.97]PTB38903.1 hypothetical protein M441DRAFT_240998 [Trichoderma asperellum CBS 433.97]